MKFLKIPFYTFLVLFSMSCGDGLSEADKAAGKSTDEEIDLVATEENAPSVVQQVSQSMVPVLEDYKNGTLKNVTQINNGLRMQTVEEGKGNRPQFGDNVFVHYYGVLPDGYKFDSSFDRMKPFAFKLGTQAVIPGWNDAVSRMRQGGSYVIFVPPALAYGAGGNPNGGIPPNTELIFYIALLGFQ